MESIWKQVLEEIQLEVSKGTFSLFKGTTLKSIDNNIAVITTPSFMLTTMIEKRYYELIKNTLDKKTKSKNSLIFRTEAPPEKKQPPTSQAGPLFTPETKVYAPPERIRPEYTFESFAVSDSNQLAHTAAYTVAQDPAARYNPLFFYGTVGVGKTHLMHAIANHVYKRDPKTKVLYLTTEDFTNEVIESMRAQRMQDIRKKFRTIDLLLLDDIQFLAGKEKVQEELFHTFNALIDRKSQVIFSSDRPPQELKKIEARLASRFESGLTVDIGDPEIELRTAILRIKSRKFALNLTPELESEIVERVKDARALEGFLLRLHSELELRGLKEITSETLRPLLGTRPQAKKIPTADNVIETVCTYYNIKATQLKGAKRSAILVKPRHLCMFLLKEEAHLTYVEIGNVLGGRDHTTVMHGVEKVQKNVEKEPETKEEIMYIKRRITENYLS